MEKFNFSTITEYAEYVLGQANIVLDKCGIYGKAEEREGLMTNIKNSIRAKFSLMEIFKNSPYHNGKGQLIIPMEIERPVDEDIVQEYADYIREIAERYLMPEATIDGYTYLKAKDEYDAIERMIRAVDYMKLSDSDVVIKGKSFDEYRKKYDTMETIMYTFDNSEKYHYVGNYVYTDRSNLESYKKVLLIASAISHCIGHQLENEYDIEKLAEAFPRCQCRAGIKISRVVQKCLKEIGLYEIAMDNERETFNKQYARWTDAVSPMKIKKWSVLSINFVDYLTMCHGTSWTSCLNTDKSRRFTSGSYSNGFNSRRTLDYALDPTTMVFYTIDEGYDGDDFELQPKSTRQLFHFGEGKLVQARLYPQSTASRRSIYNQYRGNVEFLLAEAMEEANLWSSPERGVIECNSNVVCIPYHYNSDGNFIDFLDIACHGDEESDFQDEVNYVVFRGSSNQEDNGEPMIVGSTDAVCIMCGDSLAQDYTEAVACYKCY